MTEEVEVEAFVWVDAYVHIKVKMPKIEAEGWEAVHAYENAAQEAVDKKLAETFNWPAKNLEKDFCAGGTYSVCQMTVDGKGIDW